MPPGRLPQSRSHLLLIIAGRRHDRPKSFIVDPGRDLNITRVHRRWGAVTPVTRPRPIAIPSSATAPLESRWHCTRKPIPATEFEARRRATMA
jgi:hypothetical protein